MSQPIRLFALFLLVLALAGNVSASRQILDPPDFEALYAEMEADLATYEAWLDSQWDGTTTPVLFSAELASGNANLGSTLLDPAHNERVLLELNRFQMLGLQAVTLSVHFPVLYTPYHANPLDFIRYAAFYATLADLIRAHGMQIIVETQVAFPSDELGGDALNTYYQSLSFAEWIQGRAQTAATIASLMQPDYLTIISEPDTEADLGFKPQMRTADGIYSLVNHVAATVKQVAPQQEVGAGMGTWHQLYLSLSHLFCANANVDYLNLHIYPITHSEDLLGHAFEMANICAMHGKPAATGEAWLYKISETEFGQGLSPFQIFARDPFDTWMALDQAFLRVLVKQAHHQQLLFFSPYWSRYFFAYLVYTDDFMFMTPEEIDALAEAAALQAMWEGSFSPTAGYYAALIALSE